MEFHRVKIILVMVNSTTVQMQNSNFSQVGKDYFNIFNLHSTIINSEIKFDFSTNFKYFVLIGLTKDRVHSFTEAFIIIDYSMHFDFAISLELIIKIAQHLD
jgi:hypothetical protein